MRTLLYIIFLLTPAWSKSQLLFSEKSEAFSLYHSYDEGNIFGGGVTFYDFNGDGLDDLSFASGDGDSLKFYISNGASFTDVGGLKFNEQQESKQIIWVDYDNDEDPDLFVTNYEGQSRLWENLGGLIFQDVTESSGIKILDLPTFGASWGDYDRDGFLDLYLPNYSTPAHSSSQRRNYFYRNQGDGTFEEIAFAQGVLLKGDYNYYFSSAFLDLNKSGWPDLFIIQDFGGNVGVTHNILFWNDKGQYRHAVGAGSIEDVAMNAMSIAAGDFNKSGSLDVYITNTDNFYSKLHVNMGDSSFKESASAAGVEFNNEGFGWGAQFFDCDNDTWEDLGVVGTTFSSSMEPQIDRLYENKGDQTFEPLDEYSINFSDSAKSIGLAYGDYNRDGHLDFAISTVLPDSILFYENNGSKNHYFVCELQGTASNRDGIGSWVEIYSQGEQQVRYSTCGIGFLSQNTSKIHFGLGTSLKIDSLIVKWSSGWEDIYYELLADQFMLLTEGETAEFRFDVSSSADQITQDDLSVFLTAPNFPVYKWNNDAVSRGIEANKSGTYVCSVLDEEGRRGLSNPILVLDKRINDFTNSADDTLNDIIISPNPSKGEFSVQAYNFISIKIYTTSGQLLLKSENPDFDIQQFPSGIYIAEVYQTTGITTKRIIKE
ncbi:MAG: VCBS repeat-containing protein [Reichenbachiella sp.]